MKMCNKSTKLLNATSYILLNIILIILPSCHVAEKHNVTYSLALNDRDTIYVSLESRYKNEKIPAWGYLAGEGFVSIIDSLKIYVNQFNYDFPKGENNKKNAIAGFVQFFNIQPAIFIDFYKYNREGHFIGVDQDSFSYRQYHLLVRGKCQNNVYLNICSKSKKGRISQEDFLNMVERITFSPCLVFSQ